MPPMPATTLPIPGTRLPTLVPAAPPAVASTVLTPILDIRVNVCTTWIRFLVVRSAALNTFSVLSTL